MSSRRVKTDRKQAARRSRQDIQDLLDLSELSHVRRRKRQLELAALRSHHQTSIPPQIDEHSKK